MNDLIKRLRQPPFGTETSERNLMSQAADELERLYAAMAKGPMAWMYEHRGQERRHVVKNRGPDPEYLIDRGWTETPLYFIPAPEPKP